MTNGAIHENDKKAKRVPSRWTRGKNGSVNKDVNENEVTESEISSSKPEDQDLGMHSYKHGGFNCDGPGESEASHGRAGGDGTRPTGNEPVSDSRRGSAVNARRKSGPHVRRDPNAGSRRSHKVTSKRRTQGEIEMRKST